MPFIKRTVEPQFLCRDNPKTGSQNVLEEQNKFIWLNFLRQISSIDAHMNEIFDILNKNILNIRERAINVESALREVNHVLPSIKFPTTEFVTSEGYVACPFQLSAKLDQSSLALNDMPLALKDLYNSCSPMPDFHLLDKYQKDGSKTSDKYSNPNFFFQSWSEEMKKENKPRHNKKRRNKDKGVAVEKKNIADLPKSKQRELAQKHAEKKNESFVVRASEPGSKNASIKSQQSVSKKEYSAPPVVNKEVPSSQYENLPPPPPEFSSSSSENIPFPSPPAGAERSKLPEDIPPPPPTGFDKSSKPEAIRKPPLTSKPKMPKQPSIAKQPPIEESTSHQSTASASDDSFIPPPPPPPPPPTDFPPPPMSIKQPTQPKKEPSERKPAPAPSSGLGDLLDSIRGGAKLKKVEPETKKAPAEGFGDEVFAILAQKITAFTMSDSEEDEDYNENEWD